MLSLRIRRQRGAATLLLSMLAPVMLAGLAGVGRLYVVVATDGRAQATADSAAHAAASLLAGSADHDLVVSAVEPGACEWDEWHPDLPFDTACRPALDVAQGMVAREPGARLVHFVIHVDVRSSAAVASGEGRVGLQVFARVAVDRRLPVMGRLCMEGPGPEGDFWCFAVADAGAQETRPWGSAP